VNNAEAKRILIGYRPGREAVVDPDVAEALEETRRDPALAQWWKQQQAFHAAMAKGLAEAPVPPGLREQIRLRAKLVPFPWWRQTKVWAAAAAVIVLFAGAALLWQPERTDDSFATFRSRMVRTVLRQYRMDIETNDMARIRAFLATNSAPADYSLPPGLERLPPLGAGVLSWQADRVSMVCLDSGGQGTLFLFVADGSGLKQLPGATKEFAQVSKLTTVSWMDRGKVYVLAMHGNREALEKYL
jgi:hypothetical protein